MCVCVCVYACVCVAVAVAVAQLASGGRVGPPGSMSVVASLPRRLLSGFVRAAAIPGSSASRIKVPCFEDTHCLALMLLDAATTSLDTGMHAHDSTRQRALATLTRCVSVFVCVGAYMCTYVCMYVYVLAVCSTALAVDMAWGVRPRLVSLQGGVVVDNHTSSASARRRRSPTAQASAASHGSVPVYVPVGGLCLWQSPPLCVCVCMLVCVCACARAHVCGVDVCVCVCVAL